VKASVERIGVHYSPSVNLLLINQAKTYSTFCIFSHSGRGRVRSNVINLSCSPAQGKPPEAASRHGRRAMTRPLPLNQAV